MLAYLRGTTGQTVPTSQKLLRYPDIARCNANQSMTAGSDHAREGSHSHHSRDQSRRQMRPCFFCGEFYTSAQHLITPMWEPPGETTPVAIVGPKSTD